MAERKKDDVGTTGDGLGEGVSAAAARGASDEVETNAKGRDAAESSGTIASGQGEEDLTQASGGSVD